MMVVIVLVLIAFALLVDWAIAHTFCEIARMKGHSERKYFWWCFSGLPGWLMVIALPDLNAQKKKLTNCQNFKGEPAMGERYTRLFTLPKNCYVPGAPVLVEAGALLKDNAENKVIAQLKILNLQNKALKAVTVAFLPFDTTGKVLGKDFDYQYLDLNTKKNQTFGERTPVEFPDATTRAFLPAVMEVIFEDNSQWKVAPDEVWNPLPKQEPLDSALSNPILKITISKETTSEAAFRPEDLGRYGGALVALSILLPMGIVEFARFLKKQYLVNLT